MHGIGCNDQIDTVLGFYDSTIENGLYYVDYNYAVRKYRTGEKVADDASTWKGCSRVCASDLASGVDMHIRNVNQKLREHVGITINTMVVKKEGWFKSKYLPTVYGVALMHKWFIEHKLLEGFRKIAPDMHDGELYDCWIWDNIPHLTKENKLQWIKNGKLIREKMVEKDCSFVDVEFL